MQSQAFIRQLVTEAQRYASVQPGDETPRLRKQLKELNQRLSRMMDKHVRPILKAAPDLPLFAGQPSRLPNQYRY